METIMSKDGEARLKRLRIPLPLDEALKGAMQVPPPPNIPKKKRKKARKVKKRI